MQHERTKKLEGIRDNTLLMPSEGHSFPVIVK